jgi:hypothetical protein
LPHQRGQPEACKGCLQQLLGCSWQQGSRQSQRALLLRQVRCWYTQPMHAEQTYSKPAHAATQTDPSQASNLWGGVFSRTATHPDSPGVAGVTAATGKAQNTHKHKRMQCSRQQHGPDKAANIRRKIGVQQGRHKGATTSTQTSRIFDCQRQPTVHSAARRCPQRTEACSASTGCGTPAARPCSSSEGTQPRERAPGPSPSSTPVPCGGGGGGAQAAATWCSTVPPAQSSTACTEAHG